jgi:plastocyanin
MKRFIGLFVLMIVLVMAGGCTQPAQPAAVTTPVVTAVPTIPPTAVVTPGQTVMPTVLPTIESKPKITLVPQTTRTIIYMRNYKFVPQELTVLPGTGISWVNDDSTVHSVKTTGIHAGLFNSGDIVPTASWGYTFGADEGVFEFTCAYHPDMKGSIVVKNGASVVGVPSMPTPSP